MNTGIIASRYAAALLKLVQETGEGERVVRQVEALQEALDSMPELRRVLDDPKGVPPDRKISLLEAALGPVGEGAESPQGMAPELRRLLDLLIRNGRIGDVRLVFRGFVAEYYKAQGIVRGRLVVPSVSEASVDLESRLKEVIESKTGEKLLLTLEVDESLIGGFILEVEDRLLDASVSHQLEIIRRQFERRNRRIV